MIVRTLLVLTMLTGCARKGIPVPDVDSDYQVRKLFTVEGCTVYRFWDNGNPRYFSTCGAVVSK